MSSKARCICPSQRITWWIRPGPEALLRDAEAVARLAQRVLDRERGLPCSAPRSASSSHGRDGPSSGSRARSRRPSVSAGTMICVARRCGSASGSVTAMTIPKAAPSAPDENHLWPSITHSSPSRTARVRSVVGSEPGHLGLGHREERAHLARDERAQPALLLLVRAEEPEDLRVARRPAPGSRRRAGPRCSARSPRSGARRRGSSRSSRRPRAACAVPTGPAP